MTIGDALSRVNTIRVEIGRSSEEVLPQVFRTVADELAQATGASITVGPVSDPTRPEPGIFHLLQSQQGVMPDTVRMGLEEDGSGYLAVNPLHLLFPFVTHLLRDRIDDDPSGVAGGVEVETAFSWQRSTFDFFLTQEGRIQKDLDRDAYVRRLAESGFTHMEVNGLAFREPIETGPPEETYPMFYTYCPALDQFVESDLGAGLYPEEYLSANREYLRTNA